LICNQVLEHVANLDEVLLGIASVLKPGGQLLTLFPAREVIREGHCGVSFIHWLSKGSPLRYPYMRCMRELGFGYCKEGKTKNIWTREFIDWLDKYTIYRSYEEIMKSFSYAGFIVTHCEEDYIDFRLRNIGLDIIASIVATRFLRNLVRYACRRLGGMVIVARKVER
jgi:hypothetical protein